MTRKAGATVTAENGATPHQLMAIFGWNTLAQAELTSSPPRAMVICAGREYKRGAGRESWNRTTSPRPADPSARALCPDGLELSLLLVAQRCKEIVQGRPQQLDRV